MQRTEYRGFIIDTDGLGRQYIYNTASPYAEDSDQKLLHGDFELEHIKRYIDAQIKIIEKFGSPNPTLSVQDFVD